MATQQKEPKSCIKLKSILNNIWTAVLITAHSFVSIVGNLMIFFFDG